MLQTLYLISKHLRVKICKICTAKRNQKKENPLFLYSTEPVVVTLAIALSLWFSFPSFSHRKRKNYICMNLLTFLVMYVVLK